MLITSRRPLTSLHGASHVKLGALPLDDALPLLARRSDATEVVRWNLVNAWPREWRGTPLDAMGQEIAIETLTLVFETLERG